jgi:hypothetical protein
MSALVTGIFRRCAHALRSAFAPSNVNVLKIPVATSFADIAFADIHISDDDVAFFSPDIYVYASVAALAALLSEQAPCVAQPSTPDAARRPTSKRTTARPLAIQLAVTAARNVRKGRKALSATPSRARGSKAKPLAKVSVKRRAPKRRHVWLSAQRRVIVPVPTNVIALARQTRITTKASPQKTPAL